ncbi:Small ubiquitin-related modifier 2 [Sesamum angolense]|uniref:Small ubiquitin-related modifier 2 n=1 Tax=Sesamum angolense TaxID=2727404 RepID=A0AAE1W3Y5_9LAMI|nr:Small ubiquitin-related modifier 2 [Sesamum angolense]
MTRDMDFDFGRGISFSKLPCKLCEDRDEVYYRFPRDKKLQHLFSSYCKQKKLNYDAIAFVHDGKRVKASKNPVEMEMEDGDSIDAMMHQDGGGYMLVVT